MKLKNRIIISFFVIILVPLILTVIAFMGFTSYQMHSIEKQYGIEGITYESLSNNTFMLSKMTQKLFDNLQKTAKMNADNLEDVKYLDKVNEDLKAKNAYLLIRKEYSMIYNGSDEADSQILLEELPDYGDAMAGNDRGVYIGADIQALVKQVDFEFQDGSAGSAFIVSKADTIIPQMQHLMADMVFVIVLILIVTSLGLCMWTYRGVITPLNQLKEATKNIKE